MAAETAVEAADSTKAGDETNVRRHISTSSQHSDHTLCNEPMAAKAPQAVATEESALAQVLAAGSPRVEKRPSLMQRFLGAAAPSKRVSPPASVHSSTSGTARRGAGSEAGATFEQKYGTCSRECIGQGATAVVRVAYKQHRDGPQVYAIKRFRKQHANETERKYVKKLTSEYCISSSVHHKNVVSTLDLIQDPHKNWCQVMEYCPGGDLYTVIRDGSMGLAEHECCFKQLCEGVAHLHSLGVCHRDIKAENLLLDAHNTVKITDFGVADVFRVAWEQHVHKSRGLCGSEPYIAPEMFTAKSYDGRKADVWSAAVVFYTMVYNGIPWRAAKEDDTNYARYLEAVRAGRDYEGFRRIDARSRRLIQRMLNPDPAARPTMDEVLESDVMRRICVCDDAGRVPGGGTHEHYTEEFEERMASRRMRAQAGLRA
ncbi:hypothetical protein LPJ77_001675 [Coemansia sp. RSA 2523]|nr:hypothetical protein LPJ58_000823 [Coemansia sp. RSA 1591]KAJ1766620.1 hypothetical protein LPJ69_000805 [Coemansia sp. RSA 1752]KAJ1779086.1 hypothetical protein LPJ54_001209 [Coemansia sp. RSA 1824]KAJ1793723.1 hypothetical protein LPJ62_000045 [Coemansia sp. RSA 2167]KAJ1794401.1 hypothetical protein LPJ67_000776 [Coemansia sp. RSA 1938]KAJ1809403.1 hypothetical protein LPJ77_001675 [Coemansia sp. RSA 2523]KAJ2127774.1 hypothetical protein GGH17_004613 [Coemansia sp. RSA 788]KAJ2154694